MAKFKFIRPLLIFLLLVSCNFSLFKVKWLPQFKGVDPKVQSYTDEFFDLSVLYGINFNHRVTIGFDNINIPNVIAQCQYGVGFREIVIDSTYWKDLDSVDRTMVLEHELGHCYCNEGHQFGKNHTKYSEDGVSPQEGFFGDSCPKSLMYPYNMYQGCVYRHLPEYLDDLFENCNPY